MLNLPVIAPLNDAALTERLQFLIDHKTTPLGALGRLEELMLRLGLILGEYESREAALAAIAELPEALRHLQPYPRQVARLQ